MYKLKLPDNNYYELPINKYTGKEVQEELNIILFTIKMLDKKIHIYKTYKKLIISFNFCNDNRRYMELAFILNNNKFTYFEYITYIKNARSHSNKTKRIKQIPNLLDEVYNLIKFS